MFLLILRFIEWFVIIVLIVIVDVDLLMMKMMIRNLQEWTVMLNLFISKLLKLLTMFMTSSIDLCFSIIGNNFVVALSSILCCVGELMVVVCDGENDKERKKGEKWGIFVKNHHEKNQKRDRRGKKIFFFLKNTLQNFEKNQKSITFFL